MKRLKLVTQVCLFWNQVVSAESGRNCCITRNPVNLWLAQNRRDLEAQSLSCCSRRSMTPISDGANASDWNSQSLQINTHVCFCCFYLVGTLNSVLCLCCVGRATPGGRSSTRCLVSCESSGLNRSSDSCLMVTVWCCCRLFLASIPPLRTRPVVCQPTDGLPVRSALRGDGFPPAASQTWTPLCKRGLGWCVSREVLHSEPTVCLTRENLAETRRDGSVLETRVGWTWSLKPQIIKWSSACAACAAHSGRSELQCLQWNMKLKLTRKQEPEAS